jgi:hypothetical protein
MPPSSSVLPWSTRYSWNNILCISFEYLISYIAKIRNVQNALSLMTKEISYREIFFQTLSMSKYSTIQFKWNVGSPLILIKVHAYCMWGLVGARGHGTHNGFWWTEWLLVDRMVAGEQNSCWWAEWLIMDRMVAGGQNGCLWTERLLVNRMVAGEQNGC